MAIDSSGHAIRLHLGCGLKAPPGWINVDGSWSAYMAKAPLLRNALRLVRLLPANQLDAEWAANVRVMDITRPLPFGTGSVDAVYASHTIEHLYLAQARALLAECHRVLRPGGVLRLVVPDLRAIVLEYLESRRIGDGPELDDLPAGDRLNHRLGLRSPEPPRGNLVVRLYRAFKDYNSHKWMYDAESLAHHVRHAGFDSVEPMGYLESRIANIGEVESADRLLDGRGICVEGVKPGLRRDASRVAVGEELEAHTR